MLEYAERDLILKSMGFTSYADYLASDLWAGIRKAVKFRDKFKCLLCNARATEVHHKDYKPETLQGREASGLVSLCARCHGRIEFHPDGTKRTLNEANSKLRRISAKRNKKRKTRHSTSKRAQRIQKRALKNSYQLLKYFGASSLRTTRIAPSGPTRQAALNLASKTETGGCKE